jgi:hypothetical protein
LLSLAQADSSIMLPTHEILNTLFTILVNLPSTLASFTAAGGYETIAGLLKLAKKEVKVKAVELLVYLGSLAVEEVNNEAKDPPKVEIKQPTSDVFGSTEPIDAKAQTRPTSTSLAAYAERSTHGQSVFRELDSIHCDESGRH